MYSVPDDTDRVCSVFMHQVFSVGLLLDLIGVILFLPRLHLGSLLELNLDAFFNRSNVTPGFFYPVEASLLCLIQSSGTSNVLFH